MNDAKPEWRLEDFPCRSFDKLRRGDLGQQGHVHNAVFPAFCDTGRAEFMDDPAFVALMPGCVMFVARFAIDYRAELFWPGTVEIGTGISAIGRTSVTFVQGVFQDGKCAAHAETVMVQVDGKTSRPVPMTAATKAWLRKFVLESK